MDLYDRIKLKREELGLSQEELAEKLGYKSRTSIHKIEQKLTDIPFSKLNDIALVLNTSLNYLLGLSESNLDDEFIAVPVYGRASAGKGSLNIDEPIDEFNINSNDYKKNSYIINVNGDSMVSNTNYTIPNGSKALVDPYYGDINNWKNKVFVFTYKGETFIKQFKIDNQNIIRLHSFNQEYEDIIVLNPEELSCNGRVIKIYYEMNF